MTCKLLILFLLIVSIGHSMAQSVVLYKVKIVTVHGNRFRGILDDVSETHVSIGHNDQAAPWFRHSGGTVALADVRKVIVRKQSRRRPTMHGAIAGGLLTGLTAVLSSHQHGFRSPVLYGLNLVMATAGGAVPGALIGRSIGSLSQKTIRPRRRSRYSEFADDSTESLRRQLAPFTYSYQSDVLNRVRP